LTELAAADCERSSITVQNLEEELRQLQVEKELAVEREDYDHAIDVKAQICDLERQLEEIRGTGEPEAKRPKLEQLVPKVERRMKMERIRRDETGFVPPEWPPHPQEPLSQETVADPPASVDADICPTQQEDWAEVGPPGPTRDQVGAGAEDCSESASRPAEQLVEGAVDDSTQPPAAALAVAGAAGSRVSGESLSTAAEEEGASSGSESSPSPDQGSTPADSARDPSPGAAAVSAAAAAAPGDDDGDDDDQDDDEDDDDDEESEVEGGEEEAARMASTQLAVPAEEMPATQLAVPAEECNVPCTQLAVPADDMPATQLAVPADQCQMPVLQPGVPAEECNQPVPECHMPATQPAVPAAESETPAVPECHVTATVPSGPGEERSMPATQPGVPAEEPLEQGALRRESCGSAEGSASPSGSDGGDASADGSQGEEVVEQPGLPSTQLAVPADLCDMPATQLAWPGGLDNLPSTQLALPADLLGAVAAPDCATVQASLPDLPDDSDAEAAAQPACAAPAEDARAVGRPSEGKAMCEDDDFEEEEEENEPTDASTRSNLRGSEFSVSEADGSYFLDPEDAPMGMKRFQVPASIHDKLFNYQRSAVRWMWLLYCQGKGGVLADEMGLGKTIMVSAFLEGMRTAGGTHALVILPVTLINTWEKELKQWAPSWKVFRGHGTVKERRLAMRECLRSDAGVLIVSYESMKTISDLISAVDPRGVPEPKRRKKAAKKNNDDDSEEEDTLPPGCIAEAKSWDVVVLDEAHRVKNPSCIASKAIRKVASRTRLLLTGTPVQNKLDELWALMDYAQPTILGDHHTFTKNFSDPIDRGSSNTSAPWQVELKDHLAKEVKRLIGPHFMRRTKVDVGLASVDHAGMLTDLPTQGDDTQVTSNLPPKVDVVVWLKPVEDQVRVYKTLLEHSRVMEEARGQQKMTLQVFRAIGLLKKVCNHPLMCLPADRYTELFSSERPDYGPTTGPQEPAGLADPVATVGSQAVDTILDELRHAPAEQHLDQSAKLQTLDVLLPALHEKGRRCLIFSHSTRMLDLIQYTVLRPRDLKFLRVDGGTDPELRAQKVNKFQKPGSRYFCMLLTVQVGGVGLTLTAADRVILVDPAWNPAVDAQAIARVWRIGQQHPVQVYRLLNCGTIEDKMFRLQIHKTGMEKTILEAENQVRYFQHKDFRTLFELGDINEAETQAMLQKVHGDEAEEMEVVAKVLDDIPEENEAFWSNTNIIGFGDYNRLFTSLEGDEPVAPASPGLAEKAAGLRANLAGAEERLRETASGRHCAVAKRQELETAHSDARKQLAEAVEQRQAAEAERKEANSSLSANRRLVAQNEKQSASSSSTLSKAKSDLVKAEAGLQAAEDKEGGSISTPSRSKVPAMREKLQACKDRVEIFTAEVQRTQREAARLQESIAAGERRLAAADHSLAQGQAAVARARALVEGARVAVERSREDYRLSKENEKDANRAVKAAQDNFEKLDRQHAKLEDRKNRAREAVEGPGEGQ